MGLAPAYLQPSLFRIALCLFLAGSLVGNSDCFSRCTPKVESGLEGVVTKGPMCPGPARSDRPCPDVPVSAAFEVLSVGMDLVAVFQSDSGGHFRVILPPGCYTIFPKGRPRSRNPLGDSAKVTVSEGRFAKAHLYWDTGMR